MSKIRSSWSGPTPADIMAASGRESIVLLFLRTTGAGRRRQLLVQVGPAYWESIHGSVNFEGRTTDDRYLIKGRMDSVSCLAVIERQPIEWVTSQAS